LTVQADADAEGRGNNASAARTPRKTFIATSFDCRFSPRQEAKAFHSICQGQVTLATHVGAVGLNPAVDDLLERVRKAAETAATAEASRHQAREDLRRAVVEAHQGGHSYTAIGRVLGVSRQRVAEIVQQEGP